MIKTENNKTYHDNIEYISCSALKQYLKSPAHYKAYIEEEREQTPALIFGSFYHLMILEPAKVKEEFITELDRPDKTKIMRAQMNKQWKENSDKTYINMKDVGLVLDMKKVLNDNENLKYLINKGVNEVSYYLEDLEGVKVKCRPDKITENAIIDLKTCEDASVEGFTRQIFKYGYHIQAAMYLDILQQITGKERQFIFLAQEKKKPYAYQIFRVDNTILEQGRYEYKELLKLHKKCLERNEWLGYESFSDSEYGVVDLTIPGWAIRELNFNL